MTEILLRYKLPVLFISIILIVLGIICELVGYFNYPDQSVAQIILTVSGLFFYGIGVFMIQFIDELYQCKYGYRDINRISFVASMIPTFFMGIYGSGLLLNLFSLHSVYSLGIQLLFTVFYSFGIWIMARMFISVENGGTSDSTLPWYLSLRG